MMMDGARKSSPSRSGQRGIVSIVAAILLIAVVVFILSQTYGIIGNTSNSNTAQGDSVKALFLAESGLERAYGILRPYFASGTMTANVCTTVVPATNLISLGDGSFSYDSATPYSGSYTSTAVLNNTCSHQGTPCTICRVKVTATVGTASRTVQKDLTVPSTGGGVSGCGETVTMTLANPIPLVGTGVAATAVFNLAWRRVQNSYPAGCTAGAGGNADAAICGGVGSPTCILKWNVESSSGLPSGGSMGSSVAILPGASHTINQTISTSRTYVQVGALFPGFDTENAPAIVGSYWDDGNGGSGTKTVNNAANTPSEGRIKSGVATTGVCSILPSADHSTNATQTCTSWCQDADTLVLGITGRSATQADTITAVSLNTQGSNGYPAQALGMTRLTRYPNTSGTPATFGDIFSEIWYSHNPPYSYGAQAAEGGASIAINQPGVTGGLTVTTTAGSNTFTVSGTPIGSALAIGDKLISSDIPIGTTITAYDAGTNTYTMSNNANAGGTYSLTSTRHVLTVTGVNSGTFLVGQTLSSVKTSGANTGNVPANTTIASLGTVSSGTVTYYLKMTTEQAVTAANRIITAGATSTTSGGVTTVSVAPGGTLPTLGTILQVRSGAGRFAALTTVVEPVGTTSFTVSATPGISLAGAQICGGTCAFFNEPSSPSVETTYAITRSNGTDQWASGFVCLKGVDGSRINFIPEILPAPPGQWTEVVK